jgi:hypothetical protein
MYTCGKHAAIAWAGKGNAREKYSQSELRLLQHFCVSAHIIYFVFGVAQPAPRPLQQPTTGVC